MNQFNSSQQRVATYQDIEQQMQIAAIKYWASEGKTAPQITDILVTPHELSHGTSALVEAYSTTLGVSPAALSEKYAKAPLRYSADIQFVVSKDPMAAFRKVSGLSAATSSARGKTFGFEYFHGGLVPIGNVRISPAASQRETMIVFDSAFATQSREAIMNCINDVGELVSLSNHDPLHSINGRLADFDDLDCHYRFGERYRFPERNQNNSTRRSPPSN